ncbi:hypothetical protein AYI68_g6872 [Smittium mucronatum]|uniref:Uncharacterized protein n=1 Tax=Smittium mucronatum TaxID=133383 RepID=A0A1R0GQD7_9FUNG|nr:hypothetical protein AYI68_g6872 [Smittium mucronatum]
MLRIAGAPPEQLEPGAEILCVREMLNDESAGVADGARALHGANANVHAGWDDGHDEGAYHRTAGES